MKDWNKDLWMHLDSIWARRIEASDIAAIPKDAWDVAALTNPEELSGHLEDFVRRFFELIGKELNAMSNSDWRELISFAQGIDPASLKDLSASGITMVRRLATCAETKQTCLTKAQIAAVIYAAKREFGDVSRWGDSDAPFKTLGTSLQGLDTADVAKLGQPGTCKLLNALNVASGKVESFLPTEARVLSRQLGDNWMVNSECDVRGLVAAVTDDDIAGAGPEVLQRLAAMWGIVDKFRGGDLDSALLMRRAVGVYGDASTWDDKKLNTIMGLLPALEADDLAKLPITVAKKLLSSENNAFAGLLDEEQLLRLANTVEVGERGPPLSWSRDAWSALGVAAPYVLKQSIGQLDTIASLQAAEDVLGEARGELLEMARAQLIKAIVSSDLPNEEVFRKIGKLAALLSVGDIAELKVEALNEVAKIEPGACPAEVPCDPADRRWGSTKLGLEFCTEQLSALLARAAHFTGSSVKDWDTAHFERYREFLVGLAEGELSELPEGSFEVISKITCWDEGQLRCIAERAVQLFNGGDGIESWTAAQWEMLGSHLAAGLSAKIIAAIPAEKFGGTAARILGDAMEKMDSQQTTALLNKAKEVAGSAISKWTRSNFEELPGILATLTGGEINSIDMCALRKVTRNTKRLLKMICKGRRLHLFSPEQIGALFSGAEGLEVDRYCQGCGPLLSRDQLIEVCARAAGRYGGRFGASVGGSAGASAGAAAGGIAAPIGAIVGTSVGATVGASVGAAVGASICDEVWGITSQSVQSSCAAADAANSASKLLERVISFMVVLPAQTTVEQRRAVGLSAKTAVAVATSLAQSDIRAVHVELRAGLNDPAKEWAEVKLLLASGVSAAQARGATESLNERILGRQFRIEISLASRSDSTVGYVVDQMAQLTVNVQLKSSSPKSQPSPGPAPPRTTMAPTNNETESAAANPHATLAFITGLLVSASVLG